MESRAERIEKLLQSFRDSPVVTMGEYRYYVNPLTDGLPLITQEILNIAAELLLEKSPTDYDYIMTPEAAGIPISIEMGRLAGKSVNIIRKKSYKLPGEVEIVKKTGYAESKVYINCYRAGDRVLLVDDLVSTGGTLIAITKALRERGVEVVGISVVAEKAGKEKVEETLGIPIKSLVRADVMPDGSVRAEYVE